MNKDPYQVALDIGSGSIKLCVIKESLGDSNKLQVLTLIERDSAGIKRGIITNMSEATESIVEIINQAESIIGLPIRSVIAGINSASIGFINSEGYAVITGINGEITDNDIDRAVQDSLAKSFSGQNQEIIHLIPKSFAVDNQRGIRNPVGMIGGKLEVKTLIISCENSYLRNFNKVLDQARLNVQETVFTPLATGDYVLSLRQKKAGTILIDLGYASTSYIVWENEEIITSGILPVGADHITADLAVGLQVNIEMAEEIKRQYLNLNPDASFEEDQIEIYNPETSNNERFRLSEIRRYARPRVEELFLLIYRELKRSGKTSLAGGAVLVGGGSMLAGIEEVAKSVLKLPTFKFNFDPNLIEFIPEYNGDPAFINCIALAAYSHFNSESGNNNDNQGKKTKNPLANFKNTGVAEGANNLWSNIQKFLPW